LSAVGVGTLGSESMFLKPDAMTVENALVVATCHV
jgi:hypothetical protein